MYRAKGKGRAQYEVFDPQMNERALERLRLETDLRQAVERNELRLHYQPIVRLDSDTIFGFEALLRWQHPRLGMLAPGDFIALAEETGAIVALGQWVVSEACRQLQEWQSLLPPAISAANIATFGVPLQMTLNLSAREFRQRNLVEQVKKALTDANLDPRQITLEITESVVMEDAQITIGTLRDLKNLGVQLAIDDFGTGYSSLSYLRRFPVNTLKIDRSFVGNLGVKTEDAEIVRAIVSLARTLGLKVVAEGVETHEQLSQLESLQCELVQGYLYSRPLPAEAIAALLVSSSFATKSPDEAPVETAATEASDKVVAATVVTKLKTRQRPKSVD
jgi:EAL domain-containing protein (putative c-di-GMP-specific phosphodiesterase class I)